MSNCPDCSSLNRRDFIKATAGGIIAASAAGKVYAEPAAKVVASSPETLVASLFKTLSDEQKKAVAFPFDHPERSRVENNWNIVDQTVAKFFDKDQQAMIREIFTKMHSPEYAARVMQQVEHDNKGGGGFGGCSVAFFGEPGEKSKFEFVFTGRHVTRRCDGNSVEGAAFGGPIFYGHAFESFNEKPDHPGNVYWYQGVRANEVFKALDGKQQKLALRTDPRPETGTDTVKLGKRELHGIPMTDLSADQKELVRKVMDDVLAPFRKEDSDEAMKLVTANGGFDKLRMAFYSNLDIGEDKVWDVWQVEGPGMVWYFRGHPHVHTWVNIREG